MRPLVRSRLAVVIAVLVLICTVVQVGLVAGKTRLVYFQDWFVCRERFKRDVDLDLFEPIDLGYYYAIRNWIDKHPDVELKFVDFDPWTQQTVLTALATGTCPSFYVGNVIGGWLLPNMRKAFYDGYAADITALFKKYGCDKHIPQNLMGEYKKTCQVGGKWYGIVSGGGYNGLVYRKDLFKAAGLTNPAVPGVGGYRYNWSIKEFREILRKLTKDANGDGKPEVYGYAIGSPNVYSIFTMVGMQNLSDLLVPEPSKPWKWRLRLDNPLFLQGAQMLHDMIYKDKSILINTNGEEEFNGGRAAMFGGNQGFGTDMSKYKALFESLKIRGSGTNIIGWMPFAVGPTGMVHTFPFIMIHSFNPRLSKEELEVAFDFCEYMLHGEGWMDTRLTIWEQTESAYKTWDTIIPYNGYEKIEGVPTARFDAYDKEVSGAVKYVMGVKTPPDISEFFPPDNDGPGQQAIDDFISKVWNIEKLDVKAAALEGNKLYESQAAGFSSKFSKAEFIKYCRAYYTALLNFYQKYYPAQYKAYLPWYQKVIAPKLK